MRKDHANLESAIAALRQQKRHRWAVSMAIKAILLSIVASGAGFVVGRMALPKLIDALHGMGQKPPELILTSLQYQDLLPLLPLPGLVLGIAALMFRVFRPLLAPLAMLAAVLATFGIVAMLIGSMAPLYQIPRGLNE